MHALLCSMILFVEQNFSIFLQQASIDLMPTDYDKYISVNYTDQSWLSQAHYVDL